VNIDRELQAQVDSQLLEQGAFTPFEMLIQTGRLDNHDYEGWRRRETAFLDEALMGAKDKIRAQLEAACAYARRIGLVAESQDFFAWAADPRDRDSALRASADPEWHRLLCSRFVPAQRAQQLDLFFDNPVVALTNGIARALAACDERETQRLLNRLYEQAPNHPDLAAYDCLQAALAHLHRRVDDPRGALDFLRQITPAAKRLLGVQARDLLTPLWRQLAEALETYEYQADEPELHRSFALSQARDWAAVAASVTGEAQWWRHAPLCLRLAQSAFYRRQRTVALAAWFHLCWRDPAVAADTLDHGRHPDTGVTALWQRFVACADELVDGTDELVARTHEVSVQGAAESPLTAADFPAWVLLREPGLALNLDADLPTGGTPAETHYRCVHQWIEARRANRASEEIALRKTLKTAHPALFRHLKQSV
jgi:hypothetical protein